MTAADSCALFLGDAGRSKEKKGHRLDAKRCCRACICHICAQSACINTGVSYAGAMLVQVYQAASHLFIGQPPFCTSSMVDTRAAARKNSAAPEQPRRRSQRLARKAQQQGTTNNTTTSCIIPAAVTDAQPPQPPQQRSRKRRAAVAVSPPTKKARLDPSLSGLWDLLPPELLDIILDKCSARQLAKLETTCSYWRHTKTIANLAEMRLKAIPRARGMEPNHM